MILAYSIVHVITIKVGIISFGGRWFHLYLQISHPECILQNVGIIR